MAKGQYHLGKSGAALCSADPSKPGGRACRYEAAGHYATLAQAEERLAREFAGTLPPPQARHAEVVRPPESSYGSEQLAALRAYRDGANSEVNTQLRRGVPLSSRSRAFLETLDGVMASAPPLAKPLVVLRAVTELKPGASFSIPSSGVYEDPGYLSCSTAPEYIESTLVSGVDEYSAAPADAILEIEVPAGGRVVALSLEDPDYAEEAEVILPRGSRMEILEDSGRGEGPRRLRARLLL